MQIMQAQPANVPPHAEGGGHSSRDHQQPPLPPAIGAMRMALGLAQGLLLYILYHSWTVQAWPATQPLLFKPLLMAALFVPLAAISAMAHLPLRKLALWMLLLAVLVATLAVYDVWRADLGQLLDGAALERWRQNLGEDGWMPSAPLATLLALGLFIAQSMVLAGHADGRYIARYHSYFSLAWKLALQVAFALLFTLLLWLVLTVGGALFALVRLDFLEKLLRETWFNIPVTTLAFSSALHLTDVKPALVAGIRKLLLAVLSWLLPLALLIVAGFLASLAATGLQPLWQTRHAASVLLGATALLVVLINVVYQDGAAAPGGGRFMAASLHLACLLPAPLTALAVYALALRVAQYGWSVDRISAAMAMLVAAIYAIGYACAALRRGRPLGLIAPTNVAAGLAILAVFLAALSPLADPARLAVDSQLARLKAGKTTVAAFDFHFMRFEGARFGVQALRELERDDSSVPVRQALQQVNRWDGDARPGPRADLAANVRVHPAGRSLPADFAAVDWRRTARYALPGCLERPAATCDAYLVTLPEQAGEQLLIFDEQEEPTLFVTDTDGRWQMAGYFDLEAGCRAQLKTAVREGRLQWRLPRQRDLELNGVRLIMAVPWSRDACPPQPAR